MTHEANQPGGIDYEEILVSTVDVPSGPELLARLADRGLLGQSPHLDRIYTELVDVFGGYSDSAAVIVMAWTLAELELSADPLTESDFAKLRQDFGGFVKAFIPDETIAQATIHHAHHLLDDQNN